VREVPLTNGAVAIVDDADYALVADLKWMPARSKYTTYAVSLSSPPVTMARLILGLTTGDGKIAHHNNRNGLDNRRSNLRVFASNVEHTQWHRSRRRPRKPFSADDMLVKLD
jgi:hypothetical protein